MCGYELFNLAQLKQLSVVARCSSVEVNSFNVIFNKITEIIHAYFATLRFQMGKYGV